MVSGPKEAFEVIRPLIVSYSWAQFWLGDGEQAMAAYAKGESAAKAIDCWSCLAEIDVDRGDDDPCVLSGGEPAHFHRDAQRAVGPQQRRQGHVERKRARLAIDRSSRAEFVC